jgi:hypothetical protein
MFIHHVVRAGPFHSDRCRRSRQCRPTSRSGRSARSVRGAPAFPPPLGLEGYEATPAWRQGFLPQPHGKSFQSPPPLSLALPEGTTSRASQTVWTVFRTMRSDAQAEREGRPRFSRLGYPGGVRSDRLPDRPRDSPWNARVDSPWLSRRELIPATGKPNSRVKQCKERNPEVQVKGKGERRLCRLAL